MNGRQKWLHTYYLWYTPTTPTMTTTMTMTPFNLLYYRMYQVSIIHKECACKMQGLFSYLTQKMDSMPLTLLGIYHHDTSHCPCNWRGAIPLTHPLGLFSSDGSSIVFGISKSCSEEKLHILDRQQHQDDCFLWNSKCLEDNRRYWMCNLIVTIISIYHADSCRESCLVDNVIEEDLDECSIIC